VILGFRGRLAPRRCRGPIAPDNRSRSWRATSSFIASSIPADARSTRVSRVCGPTRQGLAAPTQRRVREAKTFWSALAPAKTLCCGATEEALLKHAHQTKPRGGEIRLALLGVGRGQPCLVGGRNTADSGASGIGWMLDAMKLEVARQERLRLSGAMGHDSVLELVAHETLGITPGGNEYPAHDYSLKSLYMERGRGTGGLGNAQAHRAFRYQSVALRTKSSRVNYFVGVCSTRSRTGGVLRRPGEGYVHGGFVGVTHRSPHWTWSPLPSRSTCGDQAGRCDGSHDRAQGSDRSGGCRLQGSSCKSATLPGPVLRGCSQDDGHPRGCHPRDRSPGDRLS